MKRNVSFTLLARESILEIARYVAQKSQSLEVALGLADLIENRCLRYAEFPNMGREKAFLPKGVKLFNIQKYAVVYKPVEEGIVVLLVVHSSRDLPSVLHNFYW